MRSEPRHLAIAGTGASAKARRLRGRRRALDARPGPLGQAVSRVFASVEELRVPAEGRDRQARAAGEGLLAAELARRCPGVPILRDRRAPMSRTTIDHLAIAPSGVHVIDCRRLEGQLRLAKPLLGPSRLRIAGADRTRLVEGLEKQVAHVIAAIEDPDVPVLGCLCFVAPEGLLADVGLPVFRTLEVDGYPLYYAAKLAKQLKRPGPLDAARTHELALELGERLPPRAIAPLPDDPAA